MKLFLSVIFISVCFALGKTASTKKKQELEKVDAVFSLVRHIRDRVESSNVMLKKAICEYKNDVLEDVGFFGSFSSDGRISVSRAWQDGILKLGLDTGARDILLALGSNIGLLDREKQLEALDTALKKLETIVNEKKEEYARKARCYGVLGGLFGALAVIVII